jgi:hypothetical protein
MAVLRPTAGRTSVNRGAAKAAELASGLGAIVLGAGLALLAPDRLRPFALPLLLAGALVHGLGMTLKMRLERTERPPLWWEQALFWLCWACLVALGVWLLVRLVLLA